MNFGLAFSYPFKDPDWFKKIILNGLIVFIPVVGQIVMLGFLMEIISRVIRNDPNPLPELDFGKQLGKGFKAFVVYLVYNIPVIILALPIYVVPFIVASTSGSSDSSQVGNIASIAIYCLCGGLLLIYSILEALLIPAALGRVAATDSLGEAFKIGAIFSMVKSAPVPYLLCLVGALIAGFVAGLGFIVCIGVLLTVPYAQALMGHLTGQAYQQAAKMGKG